MKAMVRHKMECQILGTSNDVVCAKTSFTKIQDLVSQCESVSLEWKFLVSCLNSLQLIVVNEKGGRRKVPRTASCASASLQRVKGFPVASKHRSERAQCQAKKTGKIEETVASATKCTGKRKKKNNAVLHTMWRQKAMVPTEVRAQ